MPFIVIIEYVAELFQCCFIRTVAWLSLTVAVRFELRWAENEEWGRVDFTKAVGD